MTPHFFAAHPAKLLEIRGQAILSPKGRGGLLRRLRSALPPARPSLQQLLQELPRIAALLGNNVLRPALRHELDALGRQDLMIVVGGVIPTQDFDALRAAGADAIYPPGTVISRAAVDLVADLRERLG